MVQRVEARIEIVPPPQKNKSRRSRFLHKICPVVTRCSLFYKNHFWSCTERGSYSTALRIFIFNECLKKKCLIVVCSASPPNIWTIKAKDSPPPQHSCRETNLKFIYINTWKMLVLSQTLIGIFLTNSLYYW